MARWVGAQGQIKLAKNSKTPPHVTSPTEYPKHKSENVFKIETIKDFQNPYRVWTAL